MPDTAHAICYDPCVALTEGPEDNTTQIQTLNDYEGQQHEDTQEEINNHTDDTFDEHQDWMVDTVWDEWLRPNMKQMTTQITAVALWQFQVIGAFLDAKHQLETQRLFQQLSTTAYKDYTPSEGLCTIGSLSRSLAASDRNTELTSFIMSQRALDRQLLKVNTSSGEGEASDRESRFAQFQRRYCDSSDNTAGLQAVCQHDDTVPDTTFNKDIDFWRTVGSPSSLDLRFTSAGDASDDEIDVLALQSNLYAHELTDTYQIGARIGSEDDQNANLQKYLDMRSITAKRSVAENSYNEIVALKASGDTSIALTGQYMQAALQEMGISAPDATGLIGDNPSYYSQMEVLTRKMFQRPEFFVDLYDKPTNVERKSVALQAISVMQRRDIFKSALRTEAMMSLLLELDIVKAQGAVENEAGSLRH